MVYSHIVQVVNYSHLFPTRYALELEGLKGTVSSETFKEPSQREDSKKNIKKLLEERYATGKNKWFFQPLRVSPMQLAPPSIPLCSICPFSSELLPGLELPLQYALYEYMPTKIAFVIIHLCITASDLPYFRRPLFHHHPCSDWQHGLLRSRPFDTLLQQQSSAPSPPIQHP